MSTDRWHISREEALDARLEARIEAREQHEDDEISDAREAEYDEQLRLSKQAAARRILPREIHMAVTKTAWRRIKRPSRETIRRITQ